MGARRMWPKKLYRLVSLVLMQSALFALFVIFMQTEETWKVLSLGVGMILLGILFIKWERLKQSTIAIYREMSLPANMGFFLMVLAIPFVFQGSPYLIHIFIMAGLYAILALGLNFQFGMEGVVF